VVRIETNLIRFSTPVSRGIVRIYLKVIKLNSRADQKDS